MYKNDLEAAYQQITTLEIEKNQALKELQEELKKRKVQKMSEPRKKKQIPNLSWIIATWLIGLIFLGTAAMGGLCYPEFNMFDILWRVGLALGGVTLVSTLITAGLLRKFD